MVITYVWKQPSERRLTYRLSKLTINRMRNSPTIQQRLLELMKSEQNIVTKTK